MFLPVKLRIHRSYAGLQTGPINFFTDSLTCKKPSPEKTSNDLQAAVIHKRFGQAPYQAACITVAALLAAIAGSVVQLGGGAGLKLEAFTFSGMLPDLIISADSAN